MIKTNGFIVFTPENVQRTRERVKTQTRRIIEPQPVLDADKISWDGITWLKSGNIPESVIKMAPRKVNDILWIREAFRRVNRINSSTFQKVGTQFEYKSDYKQIIQAHDKFSSPRYMPKEAARYFIRITKVRMEQVGDISQEDAKAEGVVPAPHRPASATCRKHADNSLHRDCFVCSYNVEWNLINGMRGWPLHKNPFVWVYDYELIN